VRRMHASDERGSALLITLFLLTLFMILGFSIAGYTMHSVKQRTLAEDHMQGKMLADMGLDYFREYMERKLDTIRNFSDLDTEVLKAVEEMAEEMQNESGPYRVYDVPGNNGSFAIGFRTYDPPVPYGSGENGISQPYSRKFEVTAVGIPRADLNQKRVKLTATVYVNTVPAPFHYAVSTPGTLNLYGGTNIIGNVFAKTVNISSRYAYYTDGQEHYGGFHEDDTGNYNKPYIEGYLILGDSLEYAIQAGDLDGPKPFRPIAPERATLQSYFVPIPLQDLEKSEQQQLLDKGELSADPAKPYRPGYEPPILKESGDDISLAMTERAEAQVTSQLEAIARQSVQPANRGHEDELAVLDSAFDGYNIVGTDSGYDPDADILYIPATPTVESPTARLTGDGLVSGNRLKKLVIGSPGKTATVEMGHRGAFIENDQSPGSDTPFTFHGSMYINGNLDIVGDLDINGTIYVNGDVYIREIENTNDKNLVIIASGRIELATRYVDAPPQPDDDETTVPFMNVFLYSEQDLTIYNHASVNRLNGGISANSVTLHTRRADAGQEYAAHMVVRYDRGIFERATPGLPAGTRLFLDVYNHVAHGAMYTPVTVPLNLKQK
jgi:hypothetical protein